MKCISRLALFVVLTSSSALELRAQGSDGCATPQPISGVGTFAFNNASATTGAEGQSEALCLFFGTSGISNDVWFAWTATTSGTAKIALCTGATMDSKL